MKKITLLLALLISSIGFSQELLTNGDFSNGTDSWVGTGPFSVVSGEGYFSSTNSGGNPWDTQLVQGSLAFTGAHEYTLTFKARAAANRTITVAIQNVGIWDDQFRQDFNLTTTMTEYTATFNATSTNGNVQIGFLMAGTASTDAVYYDDVSLFKTGNVAETCSDGIMNQDETGVDCGGSCPNACPEPPTVAAPTPPARAAADVVSIYSDAYAAIPSINLDAGWCGANSIETLDFSGNEVLAYKGNACQGIDFDANQQDITGLTHIHVDFFIQAGTDLVGKVFNLKAVGPSATGSDDTVIPIDINALSPTPVPGTWYSFDLAVSFTHPTMRQFAITSNLNNAVWYDNLYLHKNTTLGIEDNNLISFKAYPNPTKENWTIKSRNNTQIKSIKIFDVLGKTIKTIVPNNSETVINASNLRAGLYFATVQAADGLQSLRLIKH